MNAQAGQYLATRRGYFEVMTVTLPIEAEVSADELNALREHYLAQDAPPGSSDDPPAGTAATEGSLYLGSAELPARPDRVTGCRCRRTPRGMSVLT